MRPGAPLSPGPKSLMRPGAPLSPGLTEKTRYKPAWFTSGGEVSQRSFLASRGPVRGRLAVPSAGLPGACPRALQQGRSACAARPRRRSLGVLARSGRRPAEGGLLVAVRLADAPPEGPIEDLRYLGRAGDRPDL